MSGPYDPELPILAELERAGVVRSGRGRVTVLQPGKLRNYIY